ncbi:hypothetical protein B0H66DRAFT_609190 [Apodospora peruviana]|uniref:Dyp-type peroxidase C-terminal domain-containing protein n=1 Tax=Apodospora peruviana TaxID=516989 RepID=A0AAE0IPF9_9PEZI|nr:hypothetical protein B0H66DRAFT_609190 [Apodospora peruviana]
MASGEAKEQNECSSSRISNTGCSHYHCPERLFPTNIVRRCRKETACMVLVSHNGNNHQKSQIRATAEANRPSSFFISELLFQSFDELYLYFLFSQAGQMEPMKLVNVFINTTARIRPQRYSPLSVLRQQQQQQHQHSHAPSPISIRTFYSSTAKMSSSRRVPISAQGVDAPLTTSATSSCSPSPIQILPRQSVPCAQPYLRVSDLTNNVSIRNLNAAFAVTVRPEARRTATLAFTPVRTTGSRSHRPVDLNFDFVDGTANPVRDEVRPSVLVPEGGEIRARDMKSGRAAGGDYREKNENGMMSTGIEGCKRGKAVPLTLRDNIPFGSPGRGEFGTYVIGYSARSWVIEKMLVRMLVEHTPGLHDRLLDYSTPLTGTTFFAPSASLLARLGDD